MLKELATREASLFVAFVVYVSVMFVAFLFLFRHGCFNRVWIMCFNRIWVLCFNPVMFLLCKTCFYFGHEQHDGYVRRVYVSDSYKQCLL